MTCYGLGAEADGDTRVGFLAGFIPPSCLFVYTGPIGLTGLPWTVICIIIIISLQEVSQTYETRVSYKDTSTKSIQNVQNRML